MKVRGAIHWITMTGLAAAGAGMIAGAAMAQTELTECGPLPVGNYELKNDIDATGDCFILMAQNVAIDLNGKTITGNGTGSAITDDGNSRDNAVIINGKIKNFETGIDLGASGIATLQKLDVSENTGDGIYIGLCCNNLTDVEVNDNGDDGVDIRGCCHTVVDSSAKGNGGDGFAILGCCSTFNDSESKDNGVGGVTMDQCCNNIDGAKISDNGGNGVSATGCCNFMRDTKVSKSGEDGVYMSGCCNLVSDSKVDKSGGSGMELDDGYNQVTSCKVSKSGETGIDLSQGDDNIVLDTQVKNSVEDGVVADCPTSLVGLKVKKSGGDDLAMDDPAGCTLVDVKTN